MDILVSKNLKNKFSPMEIIHMVNMPPEMAIKKFHICISIIEGAMVYFLEDDPYNLLGEENENYIKL